MLNKKIATKVARASTVVAMVGATFALTGCTSFFGTFMEGEPEAEPVVTTQSGTELEGSLIHSGYVLLPDGREVLCVANSFKADQGGGINCDWDNARIPSPEN